jgi:hypothetical protein
MRSIFVLVISLSLVILPCLGCGKSKPDPRDAPNFKDTSDPSMIGTLPADASADPAVANKNE